MSLRAACCLAFVSALSGCAGVIDGDALEDDFVEDLLTMPEDEGKADGTQRVSQYLSRGCTTAPVLGLAQQIAERMACLEPDTLQRFDETSDIHFTGAAILPYLHPRAADSLLRAAEAVGRIGVVSAFRTLPQQYLLYQWSRARRCGIRVAATPGRSNHETGRALDIDNPAPSVASSTTTAGLRTCRATRSTSRTSGPAMGAASTSSPSRSSGTSTTRAMRSTPMASSVRPPSAA